MLLFYILYVVTQTQEMVLLVLPSGTTIADFSVVHLAATTYVQAAPSIGGLTAVRNVAKRIRNIDTDS